MKKELGTKEKWNGKTKKSVRHDARQDDFLRRWGLLRRAQNVRGISRTSSFYSRSSFIRAVSSESRVCLTQR
ncbi:hypothetical protein [Salibacterium aidingense]|uniref:hypothetical protein n=1 Tax=Salibacterium aidingense TaxID=384933 RepID=UPI0004786BFC|nr:hypothetical protein [Salibacterium aidingense]